MNAISFIYALSSVKYQNYDGTEPRRPVPSRSPFQPTLLWRAYSPGDRYSPRVSDDAFFNVFTTASVPNS